MGKLLKVQIIACGPGLEEITSVHGVSSDWVQSIIRHKVSSTKIVKAYLGEKPLIENNTAWIIMGSRYSAYDKLDWIDNLKSRIRLAVSNKIPILGICFGHQIICSALGADVSDNQEGWEIGSSKVSLTEEGLSSPLFEGFEESFFVYQSHHDVVSRLPKNMNLLCSNRFGVQSVSFFDFVFGVQFHPEFSYEVMNAYYDARTKGMDDDNFKVLDRNEGSKIIDNFIKISLKEK